MTILGGRQNDVTEPHPLKRRATKFWTRLRTSLARSTLTIVLVSGAGSSALPTANGHCGGQELTFAFLIVTF